MPQKFNTIEQIKRVLGETRRTTTSGSYELRHAVESLHILPGINHETGQLTDQFYFHLRHAKWTVKDSEVDSATVP